MRRIFGGTLPSSSTSTSLSSDALPSPSLTPSNSLSHPSSSNSPPTVGGNQSDSNSFDDSPKKVGGGGGGGTGTGTGWFGALGAVPGINSISESITGRHNRSSTLSSIVVGGGGSGSKSNGTAVGGVGNKSGTTTAAGVGVVEESEDEASRLPFGNSRIRSPPSTPGHHQSHTTNLGSPASPRGHARNGSNYSSQPFAIGGKLNGGGGGGASGGGGGRPFSPTKTEEESQADEKDNIMVELLSGQASVEAKDYKIMDWDEMQDTKKKHAIFATKVSSLTRSLALETKLRDSATRLVRLSRPASASTSNPSNSHQVTREQAEIQLQTAQTKVTVLSEELYRVGWEEAELRTKLLKHTAGVLGLAVKRKEEEEQGLTQTSLKTASLPPATRLSLASQQRQQQSPSPTSGTTSNENATNRFDGNSFFAGNKEAIVPQTRGSPYSSPQLTGTNGTFSSLPPDPTIIKELEETIKELKEKLTASEQRLALSRKESSKRVEEEVGQARRAEEGAKKELVDSKRMVEESRKAAEESRRMAEEATRELKELKKEVETHRDATREAKDSAATAKRSMVDSQRELEDLKREAVTMRSGSSDGQREVANARQEATDLSKKLSMAQLEKEEAEHKLESFEDKVAELEEEIAVMRKAHESETRRMRVDLESKRSAEEGHSEGVKMLQTRVDVLALERKNVLQAVGDVLRRHRTRPVLGSAIRDLPAFDDTTEHDDLPSYISSTLDSHFDKVASHVTTLNEDIALLHAEHEEIRSDLQTELKTAVEHRERWRGEAETHQRAKEVMETDHVALQSKVKEQDERLASVSAIEMNASNSAAEETKLRSELASAQSKIASLEALTSETTAQHTRSLKPLQDLWKTIPSLESRTAASNSDDLSVLKAAFEAPRRPMGNFLADVTSTKFTVDAFAERIKVLVTEDQKLVGKLIAFEAGKDKDKAEAEKGKKAQGDLQAAQKQVKDLEERMEVSANQEVTMLERLNDLTESLESTRGDKRKVETTLSSLQTQVRTLEDDKTRLEKSLSEAQSRLSEVSGKPDDSARVSQLETEVEELQDHLQDLQQELDDAKKREQKQRSQLLDQLSTSEQEVSSLKTQLRQEQRKKAKA